MKRRLLSTLLASAMVVGCMTACGNEAANTDGSSEAAKDSSSNDTVVEEKEDELDYDYGLNVTFHSDEPVEYSIFFSDASWYAMKDTWQTEGLFKDIQDRTNVKLNVISYDSGDYNQKIQLEINSGKSAYIIPKVYDESAYVDGGAVVAVSDYVKYMPHYQDFVEKYNMQADLDTIIKADGKYYRLPGMLEAPVQDYTFLIRKDLFDAAGVDVAAIEKDWTYEDLYDALVKVKAHMVSKGIITEKDYVWSDLWCGSEITDGSGGNLLKLMGKAYGVNAGWAIGNGMIYDRDADEFVFGPTTDKFKDYLTMASKFVEGGILDPETFTQDNQTACNKFYRGETALLSVNRSQYTSWLQNLDEQLGAGNYETYLVVMPKGNNNYGPESSRLENGVMIAQKALDELGEEGFIKMLRFVDWMFYSHEAYDLTKWGVEGKHYTVAADGTKSLMDGYKCGGLGIAGEESDVDIRLEWGYAGGNYWYGGTMAEMTDNFIPPIMDFCNRMNEYRDVAPLDPTYAPDEFENEELNIMKTSAVDTVNQWSLQFITGQKDIDTQWNDFVDACKAARSEDMAKKINEIYKRGK